MLSLFLRRAYCLIPPPTSTSRYPLWIPLPPQPSLPRHGQPHCLGWPCGPLPSPVRLHPPLPNLPYTSRRCRDLAFPVLPPFRTAAMAALESARIRTWFSRLTLARPSAMLATSPSDTVATFPIPYFTSESSPRCKHHHRHFNRCCCRYRYHFPGGCCPSKHGHPLYLLFQFPFPMPSGGQGPVRFLCQGLPFPPLASNLNVLDHALRPAGVTTPSNSCPSMDACFSVWQPPRWP